LDSPAKYYVQVLVSAANGKAIELTASALVTVNVGLADVVAVISGGAERFVSALDDIFIDGSLSYDKGYLYESQLSYDWHCRELSPSYGRACLSDFLMPMMSNITIPAGSIASTSTLTYEISLYISNSFGASDSASMELTIYSAYTPLIAIAQSTAVTAKVNPSSKVILTATVTAAVENANALWSCDNLNASALAALSSAPTAVTVMRLENRLVQLVIYPNALIHFPAYTFTLSASYASPNAVMASSSITLVMNQPPANGVVVASPDSGYSLNTSFLLKTFNWADDAEDFPLLFTMMAFASDADDARVVIKSANVIPFASVILAQGLQYNGFAVNILVTAEDIYLCAGSSYSSVIVKPQLDLSEISHSMTKQLNIAILEKNSDLAIQVVNAVTSSINNANCSSAPLCSSMGRLPCSSVAHTCGECMGEYFGAEGHSNQPCIPRKAVSNGKNNNNNNNNNNNDNNIQNQMKTKGNPSIIGFNKERIVIANDKDNVKEPWSKNVQNSNSHNNNNPHSQSTQSTQSTQSHNHLNHSYNRDHLVSIATKHNPTANYINNTHNNYVTTSSSTSTTTNNYYTVSSKYNDIESLDDNNNNRINKSSGKDNLETVYIAPGVTVEDVEILRYYRNYRQ
jgi:hypothetical protein